MYKIRCSRSRRQARLKSPADSKSATTLLVPQDAEASFGVALRRYQTDLVGARLATAKKLPNPRDYTEASSASASSFAVLASLASSMRLMMMPVLVPATRKLS